MTMISRTTRIHVGPADEPLFSERGFSVEITDEAAGEFLLVGCNDTDAERGQIRISPSEWPELRDAIHTMIGECK